MDRGTQSLLTSIVFSGLATIFILIRCISRFLIVKTPGTEDYLIIFALVMSIGTTIVIGYQKNYGLGRHAIEVSEDENVMLMKLLYISIIIYNLGLFITKDSILYQYLRFFVKRSYRRAAWILMAIIMIAGLAMLFASIFSCQPIHKFWDLTAPGHCINLEAFWFSFSAFNIVTDIAVLILPIPVLVGLQLPKRQKISLIFVFALGSFACVTSIVRLRYLYVASVSTDLTYDNVGAATWSSIELNTAIMCACIPAMRPFISFVFPKLLSTDRRGTTTLPSYPRIPTHHRNESIVELSHTGQAISRVSRDDLSDDTATAGEIRVKHEWHVTTSEQA